MSRPGDPGRELIMAEDPATIVLETAKLVDRHGAVTFEHGYAAPPGVEWDEDYEPGPDDAVLWYAQAVIRRKVYGHRSIDTTYRGEALVRAGASHARGGAYACVDLLEKLGVNVIVVDNYPTPSKEDA